MRRVRPRLDPARHQPEQALRIGDHVAEQPVGLGLLTGVEPEGALAPERHVGQACDLWGEVGLVDGDHLGTELRQRPAPSARGRPEIEAAVARPGVCAQPGAGLPELEIGARGRPGAVLGEAAGAVHERAGLPGAQQQPVAIEQGPGAERCRGHRSRKQQRRRLHRGQARRDQGAASVMDRGIQAPVALSVAQCGRRQPDRGAIHRFRVGPDVERPGGGLWRIGRKGEQPVPAEDCHPEPLQLLRQHRLRQVVREVGGADRDHARPRRGRRSVETASSSQPAICKMPPVGASRPRCGPPSAGTQTPAQKQKVPASRQAQATWTIQRRPTSRIQSAAASSAAPCHPRTCTAARRLSRPPGASSRSGRCADNAAPATVSSPSSAPVASQALDGPAPDTAPVLETS